MSFTFSTLLSMIIINAVFVIALNQVVKTSVINYFNIDLFLLSSLVILLRFLLPFEFPFTVSVPVKCGAYPICMISLLCWKSTFSVIPSISLLFL